ncbi:unnamed protein product [Caenorhabditis auriculariae]|uniref:FHA domain-containing protein n=1 Tax=Caenorhabditis auriculariae TaxID=2777116 RepID=A0A8S1HIP0_9PELO|nr:unnamed protein product [Caenorhabditis auriculariae]
MSISPSNKPPFTSKFHLRRIGTTRENVSKVETCVLLSYYTKFGRNPEKCDVVLTSANTSSSQSSNMISRDHAEILGRRDANGFIEGYTIHDYSLNGTYVNDYRLQLCKNGAAYELKEGDVVKFGHMNGAAVRPGQEAPQAFAEFSFIVEKADPTLPYLAFTDQHQRYRALSCRGDTFAFKELEPEERYKWVDGKEPPVTLIKKKSSIVPGLPKESPNMPVSAPQQRDFRDAYRMATQLAAASMATDARFASALAAVSAAPHALATTSPSATPAVAQPSAIVSMPQPQIPHSSVATDYSAMWLNTYCGVNFLSQQQQQASNQNFLQQLAFLQHHQQQQGRSQINQQLLQAVLNPHVPTTVPTTLLHQQMQKFQNNPLLVSLLPTLTPEQIMQLQAGMRPAGMAHPPVQNQNAMPFNAPMNPNVPGAAGAAPEMQQPLVVVKQEPVQSPPMECDSSVPSPPKANAAPVVNTADIVKREVQSEEGGSPRESPHRAPAPAPWNSTPSPRARETPETTEDGEHRKRHESSAIAAASRPEKVTSSSSTPAPPPLLKMKPGVVVVKPEPTEPPAPHHKAKKNEIARLLDDLTESSWMNHVRRITAEWERRESIENLKTKEEMELMRKVSELVAPLPPLKKRKMRQLSDESSASSDSDDDDVARPADAPSSSARPTSPPKHTATAAAKRDVVGKKRKARASSSDEEADSEDDRKKKKPRKTKAAKEDTGKPAKKGRGRKNSGSPLPQSSAVGKKKAGRKPKNVIVQEEPVADPKSECGLFAECTHPEADAVNWICCDKCDQWYHNICILGRNEPPTDDKFYCGVCQTKKSHTKKSRKRTSSD